MQQFLQQFCYGKGWLAIATKHVANVEFFNQPPSSIPEDTDVWFAPALRHSKGMNKTDVQGSIALWVDVDNEQLPTVVLPPTAIVRSGHGWHLYWFLSQPVNDSALLERYNQLILADVDGSDKSTWNCNRLLRVPGTVNLKEPNDPRSVMLYQSNWSLRYNIDDIVAAAKIDPNTAFRIKSGHTRGYKTRSERDWAVLGEMRKHGMSYEVCELIYRNHKIGDKLNEDGGEHYFKHTWDALSTKHAKELTITGKEPKKGGVIPEPFAIQERPDGYYKGLKRLSTFTFEPMLLLDGSANNAEDALVGTVEANGYKWENVTFTRKSFTEIRSLDKECPVAAWQWLGSDNDLRALLPYLIERLKAQGLPRVLATPQMGLHFVKGQPYFVGTKHTLSATDIWTDYKGPLHWLPSKREHPELDLTIIPPTREQVEMLTMQLPNVNDPEVFWILTGWFTAALFKPWLEQRNFRFPTMNVTGTRGSGKSTLVTKMMMPLFGQTEAKAYDAGTTRFVALSLLGASNASPVNFSEFRYETATGFERYIRLAYDTGHDPRGRPDQTTIDYPLSAPMVVDGEDLITDPATQQRLVVALLRPAVVAERTLGHTTWNRLRDKLPKGFGGWITQYAVRAIVDGQADKWLHEATDLVRSTFTVSIPDRVRNNHIVAYFGMLVWCNALETTTPPADVLTRSIKAVCNLDVGRSRVVADDFVEAIVNEVARRPQMAPFKWALSDEGKTLFVQLTPAHAWWAAVRMRARKNALELAAVRNQIIETDYFAGTKSLNGAIMYGVNLQKACDAGLDIVSQIDASQISITY